MSDTENGWQKYILPLLIGVLLTVMSSVLVTFNAMYDKLNQNGEEIAAVRTRQADVIQRLERIERGLDEHLRRARNE